MKYAPYILIIGFFSCSIEPKTINAPVDVIPLDSMALIMYELCIVESHVQQKYIQLERYAKIMRMSGDSLLLGHGVSRKRYENSLIYYGRKPETLNGIYDSVLLKLEAGAVQSIPQTFLK